VSNINLTLKMIRKTLWHHPFLLKFDVREGFHQPPLTYDAQIMVCLVV
jgi:hypothetical protein